MVKVPGSQCRRSGFYLVRELDPIHHNLSLPGSAKLINKASQVVLMVKDPSANSGDIRDEGSIPGLGRFPGEGNGNTL